jgi:hypothetical protein
MKYRIKAIQKAIRKEHINGWLFLISAAMPEWDDDRH